MTEFDSPDHVPANFPANFPADLHSRCDANLVAYLRHLATTAPGGSFDDSQGVLTFAGGHAYPGTYTNGVVRINNDVPAETVMRRAQDFFRPLKRGYAVWIRDHADSDLEVLAQAANMFQRPPLEGNPGIAYCGGPIPMPVLDADVVIRRVDSDELRRQYLEVIVAGYGIEGMPFELAERVVFSTASVNDPRVAAFVAFVNDVALSGCMAFSDHGTSGLQWAATLPAARGKGLGKAMFIEANNAAMNEFGCDLIAGQASQMGVPLWISLGFEVVTRYRRYLAKPPK